MGSCFDVFSVVVLLVLMGAAMFGMGFAAAMIWGNQEGRKK